MDPLTLAALVAAFLGAGTSGAFVAVDHNIKKNGGFNRCNCGNHQQNAGLRFSCPKCNAAVDTTEKFCPNCGEDLITYTAAFNEVVKLMAGQIKANMPGTCTSCGALLKNANSRFCSVCGAPQTPNAQAPQAPGYVALNQMQTAINAVINQQQQQQPPQNPPMNP